MLKDPSGKVFGTELYAAAEKPEGQVTEVRYTFQRRVATIRRLGK